MPGFLAIFSEESRYFRVVPSGGETLLDLVLLASGTGSRLKTTTSASRPSPALNSLGREPFKPPLHTVNVLSIKLVNAWNRRKLLLIGASELDPIELAGRRGFIDLYFTVKLEADPLRRGDRSDRLAGPERTERRGPLFVRPLGPSIALVGDPGRCREKSLAAPVIAFVQARLPATIATTGSKCVALIDSKPLKTDVAWNIEKCKWNCTDHWRVAVLSQASSSCATAWSTRDVGRKYRGARRGRPRRRRARAFPLA